MVTDGGPAILADKRHRSHGGERPESLVVETLNEVWPDQYLIENVPEVADVGSAAVVVCSGRPWCPIAKTSPHGVAVGFVSLLFCQEGRGPACQDACSLEGVHFKTPNQQGALVPSRI